MAREVAAVFRCADRHCCGQSHGQGGRNPTARGDRRGRDDVALRRRLPGSDRRMGRAALPGGPVGGDPAEAVRGPGCPGRALPRRRAGAGEAERLAADHDGPGPRACAGHGCRGGSRGASDAPTSQRTRTTCGGTGPRADADETPPARLLPDLEGNPARRRTGGRRTAARRGLVSGRRPVLNRLCSPRRPRRQSGAARRRSVPAARTRHRRREARHPRRRTVAASCRVARQGGRLARHRVAARVGIWRLAGSRSAAWRAKRCLPRRG